ncbi:MAG: hypothetical protein EOM51_10750 [Clostridia bacterium]|nr:hypothetical protein [Clostridia bacterium]
MKFISTPEAAETEEPKRKPTSTPAGYKPNPLYIETKSRRVQLVMQPSLYTKLKHRADSEGESVNETLHAILEKAFREEQ